MQRRQQRVGKIIPGTFAHVIRQFLAWMATQDYALATRRNWKGALRFAEIEGGLGGCSVQVIRPSLVQAFLDGLAEFPGKQSVAKSALKAVEKFAVVRDLVPIPFMTGTSVVGSEGGHEPWPDSHIALAKEHAPEALVRAITLALNTGQRGSDTVRMGWTDIEEKLDPTSGLYRRGIYVAQQKTGRRLWVPFIDPEFEATLATWEKRPGPFYLTAEGKPYTRPALTTAWRRERDGNPALKPLSEYPTSNPKRFGLVLHGLRATAVVRARKRGLGVLQISNVYGMSEQMVARYSRLADQGEMAMAAVHFLDRTGGEQSSDSLLQKRK